MWDILLAFEEGAKALVGSTLVTKMMTLQTEYTGTRKTQISLHEVPMYITEDHFGNLHGLWSCQWDILHQKQVRHSHH